MNAQTTLVFPGARELAIDTRDESYGKLDETGRAQWHQKLITAYLQHGDLCDHDMSKILGLALHLVSARRNDLTLEKYYLRYGYRVIKAKDEKGNPLRKRYITKNSQGEEIVSSGQLWHIIPVGKQ